MGDGIGRRGVGKYHPALMQYGLQGIGNMDETVGNGRKENGAIEAEDQSVDRVPGIDHIDNIQLHVNRNRVIRKQELYELPEAQSLSGVLCLYAFDRFI